MNYVVVDLEMCEVPKSLRNRKFKWANETIQLGAVKLNENFDIIDSFNQFVQPELGVISTRIENLTGIKKSDIQNAPRIKEVLELFVKWIPEDVAIVAWSDNDELQIKHEIIGKSLDFEGIDKLDKKWIDCQLTFSEIIDNNRRYNLEEALNLADINYNTNIHNGLVDASNTALLFKKMNTEKEFAFNTYYMESKKEPEKLTCSLEGILTGLYDLKLA